MASGVGEMIWEVPNTFFDSFFFRFPTSPDRRRLRKRHPAQMRSGSRHF
jgi:hypothetical protein